MFVDSRFEKQDNASGPTKPKVVSLHPAGFSKQTTMGEDSIGAHSITILLFVVVTTASFAATVSYNHADQDLQEIYLASYFTIKSVRMQPWEDSRVDQFPMVSFRGNAIVLGSIEHTIAMLDIVASTQD